jgi:hypothetical protein
MPTPSRLSPPPPPPHETPAAKPAASPPPKPAARPQAPPPVSEPAAAEEVELSPVEPDIEFSEVQLEPELDVEPVSPEPVKAQAPQAKVEDTSVDVDILEDDTFSPSDVSVAEEITIEPELPAIPKPETTLAVPAAPRAAKPISPAPKPAETVSPKYAESTVQRIRKALESTGDIKPEPPKGAAETFMVPPSSLVEAPEPDVLAAPDDVSIDSFDDLTELDSGEEDSLDFGSDDVNMAANLDDLDDE